MRHTKPKPRLAVVCQPEFRVCGNCLFLDRATRSPTEYLPDPYQSPKEFACRWLPTVVYKNVKEWCGQHQFKEE